MLSTRAIPSLKFLQEVFTYNPENGLLTWKVRPRNHFKCDRGQKCFNSKNANTQAGSLHGYKGRNYIYIRFKLTPKQTENISLKAHRIIWKMCTGEEPIGVIDHIDGNGLNNRFENLRCVSQGENMKNQKLRITNTTGFMGVTYNPNNDMFLASIKYKSKTLYLGHHPTAEIANEIRIAASKAYGFHENHGKP